MTPAAYEPFYQHWLKVIESKDVGQLELTLKQYPLYPIDMDSYSATSLPPALWKRIIEDLWAVGLEGESDSKAWLTLLLEHFEFGQVFVSDNSAKTIAKDGVYRKGVWIQLIDAYQEPLNKCMLDLLESGNTNLIDWCIEQKPSLLKEAFAEVHIPNWEQFWAQATHTTRLPKVGVRFGLLELALHIDASDSVVHSLCAYPIDWKRGSFGNSAMDLAVKKNRVNVLEHLWRCCPDPVTLVLSEAKTDDPNERDISVVQGGVIAGALESVCFLKKAIEQQGTNVQCKQFEEQVQTGPIYLMLMRQMSQRSHQECVQLDRMLTWCINHSEGALEHLKDEQDNPMPLEQWLINTIVGHETDFKSLSAFITMYPQAISAKAVLQSLAHMCKAGSAHIFDALHVLIEHAQVEQLEHWQSYYEEQGDLIKVHGFTLSAEAKMSLKTVMQCIHEQIQLERSTLAPVHTGHAVKRI